jgi:hypothetical protein
MFCPVKSCTFSARLAVLDRINEVQFPVWLFFSTGFSKNISTSVGFLFSSDILKRI